MSDEQIGGMTLSDLEAIAARFSAAVATIRDAQALLGGGAGATNAAPAPAGPDPALKFTAAEQAERARLLRAIRPEEMPDDIKKVMEAEQ